MAVNYQLELERELQKNEGKTPRLLLHCCCAPCSSYVLEYLSPHFSITAHYYNQMCIRDRCLDGKDALAVKGRRVAIVDDVISTGESLSAIERLLEKAGAEIVAKAAILAEGEAAGRGDIIFLEEL